jgi:acyl carrier protein|tara:strand:- start:119 stop:346 length:228 start_codon:yes stop_codon:yes gene_type:complete
MISQKKQTIHILKLLVNRVSGKKLKADDNLFQLLDSLEIMNLLSSIEKKYKKKLNMEKILNKDRLDLKFLSKQLN